MKSSEVIDWIHRNAFSVIALDGRCGSGKTTLANVLAAQYHLPVIHMDDYYLPFYERISNWQQIPCANMDFQRLKKEVLIPASHHETIHTYRYDPHQDAKAYVHIHQYDTLIIEGSYSMHPQIRKYISTGIFLTCSKEEQLRRLSKRESNIKAFVDLWIPLEEAYIQQYHIIDHAVQIIDTTKETVNETIRQ